MALVQRAWGRSEKISSRFTHVNNECRLRVMNITPEVANAEAFPNRERHSAHHAYHCVDPTGAMIHGHADVPSVAARAAALV